MLLAPVPYPPRASGILKPVRCFRAALSPAALLLSVPWSYIGRMVLRNSRVGLRNVPASFIHRPVIAKHSKCRDHF